MRESDGCDADRAKMFATQVEEKTGIEGDFMVDIVRNYSRDSRNMRTILKNNI